MTKSMSTKSSRRPAAISERRVSTAVTPSSASRRTDGANGSFLSPSMILAITSCGFTTESNNICKCFCAIITLPSQNQKDQYFHFKLFGKLVVLWDKPPENYLCPWLCHRTHGRDLILNQDFSITIRYKSNVTLFTTNKWNNFFG